MSFHPRAHQTFLMRSTRECPIRHERLVSGSRYPRHAPKYAIQFGYNQGIQGHSRVQQ